MNDDGYHMEWIRQDDGRWAAARVKNTYGTVIEIFEYISEREYFRLKLADQLDDRLYEIRNTALIEYLLGSMEGLSKYISR